MKNAILITLVALTVSAHAGPVAPSQVAASANWVVHLDNELLKTTKIGQLLRAELANMGVEQKMQDFVTVFSFNPLDDIRDITLYGDGSDKKKAAILLDAKFDKEKIVALLRMNPKYKAIGHGPVTIHKWVDDKEQDPNDPTAGVTYGSFVSDGLAVASSDIETVKKAIDVLSGAAPNAASGVFGQAELKAEGAFIQIAANQIGDIAGQQPDTQLLKQAKELGLAIGETDGQFYIDCGLTAKSEEDAEYINKMLDGILAVAMLTAKEQPQLAQLAQKVQISRVKDTIRLRFQTKSELLVTMVREQWQNQQPNNIQ